MAQTQARGQARQLAQSQARQLAQSQARQLAQAQVRKQTQSLAQGQVRGQAPRGFTQAQTQAQVMAQAQSLARQQAQGQAQAQSVTSQVANLALQRKQLQDEANLLRLGNDPDAPAKIQTIEGQIASINGIMNDLQSGAASDRGASNASAASTSNREATNKSAKVGMDDSSGRHQNNLKTTPAGFDKWRVDEQIQWYLNGKIPARFAQ
jgi:hypothetical protein